MIGTALVDGGKLLEVVVYSLLAGVGITVAFAVGVLGAVRFAERRRQGRTPAAVAFATLSVAGVSVSFAGVVLGVVLLAKK